MFQFGTTFDLYSSDVIKSFKEKFSLGLRIINQPELIGSSCKISGLSIISSFLSIITPEKGKNTTSTAFTDSIVPKVSPLFKTSPLSAN